MVQQFKAHNFHSFHSNLKENNFFLHFSSSFYINTPFPSTFFTFLGGILKQVFAKGYNSHHQQGILLGFFVQTYKHQNAFHFYLSLSFFWLPHSHSALSSIILVKLILRAYRLSSTKFLPFNKFLIASDDQKTFPYTHTNLLICMFLSIFHFTFYILILSYIQTRITG